MFKKNNTWGEFNPVYASKSYKIVFKNDAFHYHSILLLTSLGFVLV